MTHTPTETLPPAVRSLGWVSFANDFASEMVTPLIPLLILGPLGGTAMTVGAVEGFAEAVHQVLKPVVGRWADRSARHRQLALFGYALSNLARPLIGVAGTALATLGLRVTDRLGKAIRTAPRDALLAEAAPERMRGRAFGFHRSMDHLGAALGPLAAVALLAAGVELADAILWSFIPGMVTVYLMWRAPLPSIAAAGLDQKQPLLPLDPRGRRLVIAATVLAIANLPEAFMVVWAHQAGWTVTGIAALWAGVHLVKTLVAYPAGALADRIGRERVVLLAWIARAAALACGAWLGREAGAVALGAVFTAYAISLAASEGAERALIAQAAPADRRGAAFGWYAALPGMAALPSALAIGALWDTLGMTVAFGAASLVALCAAGLFAGLPTRTKA